LWYWGLNTSKTFEPQPSPCCFSYFSDGVSYFCLCWPALWSSCLCLLHSQDCRHMPPCPVSFNSDWIYHLPRLTLNLKPFNFYLLNRWYYRCEPLCLAPVGLFLNRNWKSDFNICKEIWRISNNVKRKKSWKRTSTSYFQKLH
jgi:hypothetical protein